MFTTLQRFDEHVTDTFIYVLPFFLIEQLHSANVQQNKSDLKCHIIMEIDWKKLSRNLNAAITSKNFPQHSNGCLSMQTLNWVAYVAQLTAPIQILGAMTK